MNLAHNFAGGGWWRWDSCNIEFVFALTFAFATNSGYHKASANIKAVYKTQFYLRYMYKPELLCPFLQSKIKTNDNVSRCGANARCVWNVLIIVLLSVGRLLSVVIRKSILTKFPSIFINCVYL